VLDSAQSVLASIARGAPVDSIDASDTSAASAQALARLAAVRRDSAVDFFYPLRQMY